MNSPSNRRSPDENVQWHWSQIRDYIRRCGFGDCVAEEVADEMKDAMQGRVKSRSIIEQYRRALPRWLRDEARRRATRKCNRRPPPGFINWPPRAKFLTTRPDRLDKTLRSDSLDWNSIPDQTQERQREASQKEEWFNFHMDILRDYLSETQIRRLQRLYAKGSPTIADLARAIGVSESTWKRIVRQIRDDYGGGVDLRLISPIEADRRLHRNED